jgi:Ca2+-binding RTX toxin-like protein
MNGGAGDDKMSGGSGNDVMTGGDGNDLVMGNSGNDRFIADAGNDRIIGGSGFDTLDFSGWKSGVKVDLNANVAVGAGTDYVKGVEAVIGTAFDDLIGGNKGNNTLDGGAGNDVLRGRAGADTLTGGDGDDMFVWFGKDLGGVDHVTDFSKGDVLDLHNIFNGVAGKHGDLVKVTDGKDGLHISAKYGDKFVDVAVLDGVHGLTAADLLASGALLV